MANGSEFTSIVVTDEMVETAARLAQTNDLGGENLLKEVLAVTGLSTIRARGQRLTEEQIAAARAGRLSPQEARELRQWCIERVNDAVTAGGPAFSIPNRIKAAEDVYQYVLTGKKPGEV